MDSATLPANKDVQALRAMVLQLMAERDAAIATVTRRDTTIAALQEQIARMNRWRFGRRAEALDPAQRALFEEHLAEDSAALEQLLQHLPEVPERSKPATTTPPSSRRLPLPDHLPRVDERHDVALCTCQACGESLTLIGEDVREQLDCEPIRFFVRRHVYPKYACRVCETITATPTLAQVIDRSYATPGLLAHVLVSKYADHLPLYRQAQIAARHDVDLSRATLADWVGRCGVALDPLVQALRKNLMQDTVLHADETPVTYLAPGSGQSQRAYLFAYRTATVDQPIVVFDFCESRGGHHAQRFLGDWRGALMVDDYAGYKALFTQNITELGCWAHARRKFYDLHAVGQSAHAEHALHLIAQLYQREAQAKGLGSARTARMATSPQLADPPRLQNLAG
jgi:transposase